MINVQYAPFDLRLNTYSRDSDGIEQFFITVSDSPEGSLEGDTIAVKLESNIRPRIVALERGQLSEDEIIQFGQQLGRHLFGGEIGRLLDKNVSRCATLDKHEPEVRHRLRIRLIISVPALASIPWEFAWVPRIGTVSEGFVALNESFSLVREETLGKSLQPLTPLDSDHVRMVAMFSNPDQLPAGLDALLLQPEREGIEQVVRQTWPEVELQIIPSASAARATGANLRRLIQQGSGTHLFHYSGHGQFQKSGLGAFGQPSQGRGNLVLDKGDGTFDFLPANDLAQLLKGAGIRLAFLNACDVSKRDSANYFTGIAPALQDADIPAIVGMQFTIKDASAIVFSEQFYHVLADTGSIDRAMWSARQQLYYENRTSSETRMHRDWGTPVLYLRAEGEGLLPVTHTKMAHANGESSKGPEDIAAPSEPTAEPIRLDVAAPEKAIVGQAFELAVAIRQAGSPILTVEDLPKVRSAEGTIFRAEGQNIVKYRVEISSPDCEITNPSIQFLLQKNKDSAVQYFQLVPKRASKISIVVNAYQEDELLAASTRTQVVAEVEVKDVKEDKTKPSPAGKWTLPALRNFMQQTLTTAQLQDLCTVDFPEVQATIGANPTNATMIRELIVVIAQKRKREADLRDAVKALVPDQFADFEATL